jgi:hypothetical protein
MQIWTEKNDKAYIISYHKDLSKYDRYLSIVEKMVDSFEINSTGNITSVTDEKVHKEIVYFNSLGH